MNYHEMKKEQARRCKNFVNADKEFWKKVLDRCAMSKSKLIAYDVICAFYQVIDSDEMRDKANDEIQKMEAE